MQKASDREVIRLGRTKSPAREEIVETVSSCIQCGTCTGSCPTAPAMDYTPRQIMHMVQQRMFEEATHCRAIWLCASCYSCTVRCPRGIPVSEVLGQLRGLAIQNDAAETTGMTFNKAFLNIVRRYGRMYEPELLLRYHARQEQLGLLAMAPIGWTLFRKGKVGLLPERLSAEEGSDEVRAIFERVSERRRGAG